MINKNIKYLYEYFQKEVAEKTGFKKSKIDLQISRRHHLNSPTIDYHEFVYKGEKYILVGNDLKKR